MLQSHRWEGNIRELENEIARAAALVEDGMKVQIHHFSEHIASADALIQETLSENHILTEATDRFQRRLVEQTLMACNWNRNEAARRLGLDRGNLRKLMKRLGIRQP
jgi:anaerobic nitric oxide reductase transcription regulator